MKINRFLVMLAAVLLSIGIAYAAVENQNGSSEQKEKAAALPPADQDFQHTMKEDAEKAKEIVVAKVNGQPITMFSLIGMMNRVAVKYVQPGQVVTPEVTEQVKEEALGKLIFEELVLQAADREQISIPRDEVDKVISKIKEGFPDEESYRNDYLARLELTEEILREKIEKSQKYQMITAREIYGKVKVDPAKIEKEYEQVKAAGKLHIPDEFQVKDVLLLQQDSEEATKKRAEELLALIKEKEGDAGKLILDGTFIVRNIRVEKEKYPALYEAVHKMTVGEMSGVLKDKDSYHIIKVLKKEPARDASFEQARAFIENRLRVPAQEERKAIWEKELKQNAKIEILLDPIADQGGKEAEASGEEAKS